MFRSVVMIIPSLVLAASCSPVIHIPPGTPTCEVVLSTTSPEAHIEQFMLDGRSYGSPFFSFEAPATETTLGIRYRVSIPDRCGPQDSLCSGTQLVGTCSGEFKAEKNGRYRVLLDLRKGEVGASIRKRGSSAVYLGQEEDILGPLECEALRREEQRGIAVTSDW